MKIKTKHKLKEIVILSIILILIGILIKIYSIRTGGFISQLFLPVNDSMFEYMKIYFTSVSIVMLIEYFLVVELPNNFFLSRIFSLFIMILISILGLIIYLFFDIQINKILFLLIVFIVSIIIGQLLSYFIQTREKINNGKYIALFLYLLIVSFFVFFSFFNTINLLNFYL